MISVKIKLGEFLETKNLKDYIISRTQFISEGLDFDRVYIDCIEKRDIDKIYIIDDITTRNKFLYDIQVNNEGRNACINCNTSYGMYKGMMDDCYPEDVKICYNILRCKDPNIIKEVLERKDTIILI